MAITEKDFGVTKEGEKVTLYTITNANGNSVSLLNYGAIIQSVMIKDQYGKMVDCVLGFDNIEAYEADDASIGASVGRVAGRIAGASFTLNGKVYPLAKNDGENHIHGGPKGFGRCVFSAQTFEDQSVVAFTRLSPDGEEGYPGNLNLSIVFTFDDYDRLYINYLAQSDADTPLVLTNHAYFNLAGQGTVLNHEMMVCADEFVEAGPDNIPTGKFRSVEGTPLDFRTMKPIGRDFHTDYDMMNAAKGYDQVFCIKKTIETSDIRNCGILTSPETGITMYVTSNFPCMVVYTANYLENRPGKYGAIYNPQDAVCLETQFHPNAVNEPNFPSVILKAGQMFNYTTSYEFDNGAEEMADLDD